MRVLTVNAGSTSLKLAAVDGGSSTTVRSLEEALGGPAPDAVAHRVVHGGEHTRALLVDDAAFDELSALSELAPLHQPPALEALARTREAWPEVPNVAAFDTAFHATIPEAARTYALPARLRARVRVYGFHGLSHAWAARRVRELAPEARRVLVAHLGGGQSLCAVVDGRSVMTTMGFTPLDGLVMGTRPGAIDPGAVLWLARHTDEDLDAVFDRESGLVGLAGSADLRDVHARVRAGDPDARLAFDVWRHRAVTQAGACVAALAGLDALVFTGGIGENDGVARAALAEGLAHLGVGVEEQEGDGDRELTAPGARVRTFVVAAREDLQLAAETEALLSPRSPG